MHYQIQEMLRVERIFESTGIQEELDTYNPLIPDGANWKATFMLEYDELEERKEKLASMINIETAIWMKVDGFDRVIPIADEDLDRTTEEKTSSVHFLRFELDEASESILIVIGWHSGSPILTLNSKTYGSPFFIMTPA